MKIRNGFVSNSSSSSFVVLKDALTTEQVDQILNYVEYVENLIEKDKIENQEAYLYNQKLDKYSSDRKQTLAEQFEYYNEPSWLIKEYDDFIFGETSMDNFGMDEYFDKIKINSNYVNWDDGWLTEPTVNQRMFIIKAKMRLRKQKLTKINQSCDHCKLEKYKRKN